MKVERNTRINKWEKKAPNKEQRIEAKNGNRKCRRRKKCCGAKKFLSAPTPAPRSRKSELWLRIQLQSRLRIILYVPLKIRYLFGLEYQYFFTWIDAWCTLIGLKLLQFSKASSATTNFSIKISSNL